METDSGLNFGRVMKRRLRAAIAPLVFLSLIAYFGWNATQGAHGLIAYKTRKTLLALALADQHNAQKDYDRWALRDAGLRADRIDADLLDQQARAMLNLANPADIVVPYPAGQHLF